MDYLLLLLCCAAGPFWCCLNGRPEHPPGRPGLALSMHYVAGFGANTLTDGFAVGMSILMVLTGLPVLDLSNKCRIMLRRPDQPSAWQPPGVPDAKGGAWGAGRSGVVSPAVESLSL